MCYILECMKRKRATPEDLRRRAADALVDIGARRKRLLKELEELEEELRPLVVEAHRNEVTYVTITDRTGLAPWTIRRWTQNAK